MTSSGQPLPSIAELDLSAPSPSLYLAGNPPPAAQFDPVREASSRCSAHRSTSPAGASLDCRDSGPNFTSTWTPINLPNNSASSLPLTEEALSTDPLLAPYPRDLPADVGSTNCHVDGNTIRPSLPRNPRAFIPYSPPRILKSEPSRARRLTAGARQDSAASEAAGTRSSIDVRTAPTSSDTLSNSIANSSESPRTSSLGTTPPSPAPSPERETQSHPPRTTFLFPDLVRPSTGRMSPPPVPVASVIPQRTVPRAAHTSRSSPTAFSSEVRERGPVPAMTAYERPLNAPQHALDAASHMALNQSDPDPRRQCLHCHEVWVPAPPRSSIPEGPSMSHQDYEERFEELRRHAEGYPKNVALEYNRWASLHQTVPGEEPPCKVDTPDIQDDASTGSAATGKRKPEESADDPNGKAPRINSSSPPPRQPICQTTPPPELTNSEAKYHHENGIPVSEQTAILLRLPGAPEPRHDPAPRDWTNMYYIPDTDPASQQLQMEARQRQSRSKADQSGAPAPT